MAVTALAYTTAAEAQATDEDEIAHYVLFWLKRGLSEEEIKSFEAFFEQLKTIPQVQSMRYGRPAKTKPRDVVDNSFTFNLLATFKNMEDINVYETHPIHLDAIKKYNHYWEKVVVHDSCLR